MKRALGVALLAAASTLLACGAGSGAGAPSPGDPETRLPCTAPALGATPSASRPWFGAHATLRGRAPADRAGRALAACNLGVSILREDLQWSLVQPRRGAALDFQTYDRVVASAALRGLTLLPILDDVPSWAGPDPRGSPSRPRDYARFAAAAVRRYGPGGEFWRRHPELPLRPVHWWEHLNEVYVHDANAARYARTIVDGTSAMRAVDPQARILIAGETDYVAGSRKLRDWLGQLYRVRPGLNAFFDAVSVHPYSGTLSPQVFTPGGDEAHQARRLEEIRATLVANGAATKHLWVTEIGWSTCRTDQCVTPAQQATYLRQFAQLRATRWKTYVDAVILYHLKDENSRSKDPEANYGVLDSGGHRKPGWAAFRALARRATAASAAAAVKP